MQVPLKFAPSVWRLQATLTQQMQQLDNNENFSPTLTIEILKTQSEIIVLFRDILADHQCDPHHDA